MSLTRASRIEGGLLGMLIGDALGVPYEFHEPDALPPRHAVEMIPPSEFPRAHRGVPEGTWSDDGALALALLDSLLEKEGLDLADFSARMLRWFEDGAYTPDGRVYDVGIQTQRAFRALMGGADPRTSGPSAERENGNGSLMRVLPLALFHTGSLAELAHLAEEQSLPTHGHVRSRVCCAIYCVWARFELEGHANAFERAIEETRRIFEGDAERLEVIDAHVRPNDRDPGNGSGYVIDTLRSARDVLAESTFEDVVKSAVLLGNDTDTTACVAGGIAGIRFGVSGIPARFREALRGEHVVGPLRDRLLARHAT